MFISEYSVIWNSSAIYDLLRAWHPLCGNNLPGTLKRILNVHTLWSFNLTIHKSFLLYRRLSIFSKSVFSLSWNGVDDYQTVCRLRTRKKKKKIFPKFKFYRFKFTLNFSVSCVCVLCCAFFIEGSRLDLYSVLFFGINCGCVPLRWCVPQFTFSTNLTGEDFCVRTVLEGLFACSNSIS